MTDAIEYPFDPTNLPAELPPKIAAVFAGRYVARARFHMKQAVLLGDRGPYLTEEEIRWGQGPKNDKERVIWDQAEEELKQELEKAWNSQAKAAKHTYSVLARLTYTLGSEDYSDLRESLDRIHKNWVECLLRDEGETIHIANENFAKRPSDPGWDGDDLSAEVVEELAEHTHERTRDVLRQRLNDRLRPLFELGEKIEEGLCPPHVHCHLRRNDWTPLTVTGDNHSLDASEAAEEEPEAEDASNPPPEKPAFKLLADVERHPGELEPDEDWYGALETVWERAQLPPDSLQVIRELAERCAAEKLDRDAVEQAVEKIHAAACKAVTEELGYLGISFDFDEGIVERKGYEKTVELSAQKKSIFRCLYDAEGDLVSKAVLQKCFEARAPMEDLDELVPPGRFNPAITKLRNDLKRIELNIKREPRLTRAPVEGYRLIHKDSPASG